MVSQPISEPPTSYPAAATTEEFTTTTTASWTSAWPGTETVSWTWPSTEPVDEWADFPVADTTLACYGMAEITGEPTVIQTANYGVSNYGDGQDCSWLVTAPPGMVNKLALVILENFQHLTFVSPMVF